MIFYLNFGHLHVSSFTGHEYRISPVRMHQILIASGESTYRDLGGA